MNKKFKLFSTIASLCLAVALMAFGVWAAATSVDVKVTGSVAFTAGANVKAEVTFKDTVDNFTGITAVSEEEVLYRTKTAEDEGVEAKTKDLGDVNFAVTDETKNMVYTYTLTITNKAATTDKYTVLNVAISGEATGLGSKTLESDGITVSVGGTLTEGKIAQGDSATVVVTVTVNPNRDVTKTDIGLTLNLTMSEASK